MSSIDTILAWSGPFTSEKAAGRFRHYLEGLSEKKRAARLAALQESEDRRPAQVRRIDSGRPYARQ